MGFTTRVGNWVMNKLEPDNLIDQKQSTAVAPATNEQVAVVPEQAKDAEIVSGTFVPTIDATGNGQMEAHKHAARLRETIESFNEEKQTPLEWLVVKFFTVLAYLLPILVAYVVGCAIGQVWSGKFDITNPWSVYSYVISVGLEGMVPVMGYSVTVAIKRAAKDRSQAALPIILGLLFLGLAIGNSFAQMYLIDSHVKLAANDLKGQASLYFRSFGPLVIDTIATIFLSVVTVKNLRKFIKDMQAKEEGIHAVSRSEIAVQSAFDQAAIDRENARSDQERKRMDNELLKELTRRRNDDTLGGGGSSSKYGGGW
jgi:hypothetical protein